MHAPPVRTGIGLAPVAAVSFGVVLVSGHLSSIASMVFRGPQANDLSWRGHLLFSLIALCAMVDEQPPR
jgi:hypothetical protein